MYYSRQASGSEHITTRSVMPAKVDPKLTCTCTGDPSRPAPWYHHHATCHQARDGLIAQTAAFTPFSKVC